MTNFLHKLFLTDKQVSYIYNIFKNNYSINLKQSKTQISIIIQSDGFPGKFLVLLLTLFRMGLFRATHKGSGEGG